MRIAIVITLICAACSANLIEAPGLPNGDLPDTDREMTGDAEPRQGGDGSSAGADTGSGGDAAPVTDVDLPPTPPLEPLPGSVAVTLVPQGTVAGVVRVNFALPLQPGQLSDASRLRVRAGTGELPTTSRGLSRWLDGSWRAVQIQVDHDLAQGTTLELDVDEARGVMDLALEPVTATLTTLAQGGESLQVPRVWAVLPASWLAATGVFGPLMPQADEPAAPLDAWASACDYDQWNTAAFFAAGAATSREVWLYDRGTAFYRGYARRGDLATLQSAYKETALYFSRITLAGGSASITLPQSGGSDAKYIYTQNLAYHYLLTGDDRYREAAEGMATRAASMFDPVYEEGSFWTERNAGFTLLASIFAAMVSDDRRASLLDEARARVDAYLDMQAGYTETPANDSAGARCFGHDKVAADEDGAYPATFICSPWMSAILADGLETFTHEVSAAEATPVRAALVALGRRLARPDNRDADGRPHYILGLDGNGVADEYDEHWGETAYVIALAYHVGGRTDTALRSAALEVAQGFASFGEVGQVRSFNWQCRGAVAAPALLAP